MPSNRDLLWIVVGIIILLVVLPMIMVAFVWPMSGMWDGGHMWDGDGTGWAALMAWIIIMAILIGAIILLVRAFRPDQGSQPDPAIEALRLAFARGEISEEEYTDRRESLKQDR